VGQVDQQVREVALGVDAVAAAGAGEGLASTAMVSPPRWLPTKRLWRRKLKRERWSVARLWSRRAVRLAALTHLAAASTSRVSTAPSSDPSPRALAADSKTPGYINPTPQQIAST
jgi:hypothetical protein